MTHMPARGNPSVGFSALMSTAQCINISATKLLHGIKKLFSDIGDKIKIPNLWIYRYSNIGLVKIHMDKYISKPLKYRLKNVVNVSWHLQIRSCIIANVFTSFLSIKVVRNSDYPHKNQNFLFSKFSLIHGYHKQKLYIKLLVKTSYRYIIRFTTNYTNLPYYFLKAYRHR